VIEVEQLSFSYPGTGRPAVDGISFAVGRGEVYGLLGPSGAGKSTTQKILMGLLSGFAGKASVFGQAVGSLGRGYYERIGVCFELPALYLRLTARENLNLFAALYAKPVRSADELLRLVDLQDDADKRVESFSKGMKMRLNLCRALIHDPELLFLDEPTTGQDPARARVTRELILRLKGEGKTIFLTTHNMAEAVEVCDRVGFLVGGRIPITGAPRELMLRHGRRQVEVQTANGGGVERAVFAMDGIGGNADFLKLIGEREVVSIHTLEASLDDVFIAALGGREDAA
jgi:fluoroquinolone transport system ATP-binding protein